MGHSLAQQVMPPSEVYWPSATSRKNTGRPPPNRKMVYGMRNAPVVGQEGSTTKSSLLDHFSLWGVLPSASSSGRVPGLLPGDGFRKSCVIVLPPVGAVPERITADLQQKKSIKEKRGF
ncbi:hypothetical protein EYF80_047081 [Liparis tanakae]|uniref:Uncharacterized protein n=1 Tax=Liparis tanakae TaxID=230148 RepID=A0A4Z2FNV5_9TELE|nr:hypothetical protein EYF80_047081 [Liparis tanakae]